jgi:hypothetical protein
MRKIERAMEAALVEGRRWKSGNTAVTWSGSEFNVRLHGNKIAEGDSYGVTLDHCGWKTATTKSRLNAVLSALGLPIRVYQSKGEWFLWNFTATVPSGRFDDYRIITRK